MRACLVGVRLMFAVVLLCGCGGGATPETRVAEPRASEDQLQVAAAVVGHVDSELRRQRELNVGETLLVRRVFSPGNSDGDEPGREDVSRSESTRWVEWPATVGVLRTQAGAIPQLGLGDASPETTRNTLRTAWIQLARPRIAEDREAAFVAAEVWMNSTFGHRSVFQLRRGNGRWSVVSEEIREFW